MDNQQRKIKSPCQHKRSAQKETSLSVRLSSKECRSQAHGGKTGAVDRLVEENQRLRAENLIYQEYFGEFEERLQEQKRENEKLKKLLKDNPPSSSRGSTEKRSDVTHCLSEKTIINKLSRASQSHRSRVSHHYL